MDELATWVDAAVGDVEDLFRGLDGARETGEGRFDVGLERNDT